MEMSFHYYATYCAATLAGYSHQKSLDISHSAQLVDCVSTSYLKLIGAPLTAATTQRQIELLDMRTDPLALQDTTRIWASFHFLPYNLHADPGKGGRLYREKFRLICNPNGELLQQTVELARGMGAQATGIAIHVLADTWAHRFFAGTPSLAINNTTRDFVELIPSTDGTGYVERPIIFRHSASTPDDLQNGIYTNSVYQTGERSVMNLGHGRAGHLPDYSFARYRYLPAWGNYAEVLKDNPHDYYLAFCQMVYALRALRNNIAFRTNHYDTGVVAPWEQQIRAILNRRQLNANEDWRALGETISGHQIEDFDERKYQEQYLRADAASKDSTYLGRFILAALAQKSMVTHNIHSSGNRLAGHSIDYHKKGFAGIKDYMKLIAYRGGDSRE